MGTICVSILINTVACLIWFASLCVPPHRQVPANDDVNNPLTHSLTSLTWGKPGAGSRKMREIDKKK